MKPEYRQNLFSQLKIDEGVRHEIYLDHLGYPTFGVGHLITESDPEHDAAVGTAVSGDRVWQAFQQDLDTCLAECAVLYGKDVWGAFPGEVQEILANMMFNLGRPRLSKFKRMNAALFAHDWRTAATEGRDSLWYRQVTNRAERLMSKLEQL